jgi:hypothetical protein
VRRTGGGHDADDGQCGQWISTPADFGLAWSRVGDDRSNDPFGELQDHGTNDPSNRDGRRGQVYSGVLTARSDGGAPALRVGGVSRGG